MGTTSTEISLLVVVAGLIADLLFAIKRPTDFDKGFVAVKWTVIVGIVYALGEFTDPFCLIRFLAVLTAISSALTHVVLPSIKQRMVNRRVR